MRHNERMASISLKGRKYELRFASTSTHGSGSPAPSELGEDKQIQILWLQIRLAKLTGGHGMGFPSSYPATTSDRPPLPPPECINTTPTLTPTTWSPAHTVCTLTGYPTTTSDNSSGYTATTSNSCPDTNDSNNTRDYSGIGLGWNMKFNFTGGSI
jgi:hypothetical protein